MKSTISYLMEGQALYSCQAGDIIPFIVKGYRLKKIDIKKLKGGNMHNGNNRKH